MQLSTYLNGSAANLSCRRVRLILKQGLCLCFQSESVSPSRSGRGPSRCEVQTESESQTISTKKSGQLMYSAFNEVLRYILRRRDKGKNCGIKTKKDVCDGWKSLYPFTCQFLITCFSPLIATSATHCKLAKDVTSVRSSRQLFQSVLSVMSPS